MRDTHASQGRKLVDGSWVLVVAVACSIAVAGCDDEEDQDTGIDLGDTALPDTEEPDPDADTSELPPDTSDTSNDDDDGSMDPGEHCGVMPDSLGRVSPGDGTTTRGNYATGAGTTPECAGDVSNPGMAVYAIEASEPVLFDAKIYGRADASGEPTVEVHRGGCNDSREVLGCASGSQSSTQMRLEPDTRYYVWVYGPKDATMPQYRLEWNVEEPACNPADHPKCASGSYQVCEAADELETFACHGGCADGERCSGDTCSSASTIQVDTSIAQVGGDRYAYRGDWSDDGIANCDDDGVGLDTSGIEMFAELTGVQSGDTVVFDSAPTGGGEESSAKGDSNVAFFVLESCDADQCAAVGRFDDSGSNRFEWQAPSSGPFYLVAEVLGSRDKQKSFAFDVKLK